MKLKFTLLFLVLFGISSIGAWAQTTYTVCASGCDFTTIQAAISAAAPGDIIAVGEGTYMLSQQLVIDKNLTLTGAGKATTFLKADMNLTGGSATDPGLIKVNTGVTFNFSGFTVDGNYPTNKVRMGLVTYGTGGTIQNNEFKNISLDASWYDGRGVVVFGTDVTISNNTFINIGRIGIHVRKAYSGTQVATNILVTGNTYTGKGTGDKLDYGVEVGAAASATVSSNNISECKGVTSNDGSTSAGILATDYYGTGTVVTISSNTIHDNIVGIAMGYAAADATTATISGNTFTNHTENNLQFTENINADLDAIFAGNTFDRCAVVTNGTTILPGTVFHTRIQDAIDAAAAGNLIKVTAGTYDFTAQMNLDKDGLSITGLGNVIFQANNASWSTVNGYKHLLGMYAGDVANPITISNVTMNCNSQCFGLNAYGNAYVVFNDVTINGGKGAGLTVNGSTVIATDLNTATNAWGAVNVDPGSGVTTPSVFTLNSGTLAENTQIWSDGNYATGPATVTVNASGYNKYNVGTTKIWTNRALANCATITKGGETTIYATIQAAINAAVAGDVIDVTAGTFAENIIINKALTLQGANFNTACSSRSAESIIAPATGLPVSITADGVIFNGFEITAPAYQYAVVLSNRSNVSVLYNNIHDIGTTVTGTNVHAINYTVANASSTENITISYNCLDNISSSGLTGYSAAAIGILQSPSTGVLTGLAIENNTISDVNVNTGNWPTGKLAYGIVINVGGGSSYQTTTGKVVNVTVSNNTIAGLSGFISTGIGLEGNTENAVVQGNSVSNLTGYKTSDRSGGGYDLSALKFENNRYAGTVTVVENLFNTNTFVHNGTTGRGYAVSNYVPSSVTGAADVTCNWFGTADALLIADNAGMTGKIFNKSTCETNFLPFWSTQTGPCNGLGPVLNVTQNLSYMTIQSAINAANDGDLINVSAGTYTENININKRVSIIGSGSGASGGTILTQTTAGAGDTKIGIIQLNASGLSAAEPILIKDMRIQPVGMAGISVGRFTEATGTNVEYLKFENVYVIGTNTNPSTEQERGFYVDNTSGASNLVFENCAFNNLTYGWYLQKQVSADVSTVSNVAITNTLFNHNNHKGFYAEKLSNVTFTNCTAHQNGYDASVLPSYFQAWSAGIDLNLKAGSYTGLTFEGCTITNNGIGGAKEGAGLAIKGRDDVPSYGTFPAILSNVTVQNCTITGNERGIRIGEPGKNAAQPTNVVISNNTINNNRKHYAGTDGTDYGDVVNMLSVPVTLNSESVLAGQNVWYVNNGESIQTVVNAALAGDVIHVAAGTFNESVTLKKSLTLLGAGCGQTIWQGTAITGRSLLIQRDNTTPANVHVEIAGFSFNTENNQSIRGDWSASYTEALTMDIHDNCFAHVNTRNPGNDFALYLDGAKQTARGTEGAIRVYDNTFNVTGGVLFEYCRAVDVTDNEFNVTYEAVTFNSYTTSGTIGDHLVEGNLFNRVGSEFAFAMNNWFGSGTYTVLPSTITNNSFTNSGFSYAIAVGVEASQSAPFDLLINQNSILSGTIMLWGDFASQAQIDATCNWWGTTNPYTIQGRVPASASFLPFSSSAAPINCEGYGPVVVYEGSSSTVRSSHMKIQTGIDAAVAGDLITVAAGTYTEQLHITTNDLTIQGVSKSSVIVKSPATLPLYFTTGANKNYPVVFVEGVNLFNMSNITVDGDGKGNANYRFQGIGFWNAGGTLDDVDVYNIIDTPFSGAQHGVAVYAYNNTNGPYTISCSDMVIDDYQKNAMALSGVGLTIALDNITTIGAGPTSVTAQNGIQVAYGASGTITNSNVSGNIYTGENWSSAGILLYQGNSVAITNTTISDNYTGLDVNDCNGSITNSTVSNQNSDSWDGIYLRKSLNTPMNFDLTGVTVTGHNKADSWGVYVRANTGSIESDITQCQVSNWGLGVYTREATGGIVNVLTNNNVISGNTDGYSANTITSQDATLNYWGVCPSVSGLATYFPYWSTVSGTPGSFDFDIQIDNITASATSPTICAGSSTTILGTGGSEYLWDNGLGLGASKVVSPVATTTYNVTSKDANGCNGAFGSVTVTVTPAPTVTIAGPTVVSLGGSVTLTASGATTYAWSNGATGASITVSPTSATTYSVTGTTGTCSGTATHTVTVASVDAGANQFICNGGSATLTVTCNGFTPTSYLWTPGNLTTATVTVSPTSTTTYTVLVDGTMSDQVTVFVRPKPVANAGPDITIATGGNGTLTGSASAGTAPYNYSWTGPSGFTSAAQSPTVTSAGTYTLVVTDAYGCTSVADQAVVTVAASGYTVSGNVSYYNTLNNQMHNVTVRLKQDTTTMYSAVTPATGNGNFQILGVANGTYTVHFSLPTAWGGVTSADIVAIQNHYKPVNPTLLVGLKRLAADVIDNSSLAVINLSDRNQVNAKRLNPNGVSFATGNWVFVKDTDVNTYTTYANSAGTSNITITVEDGAVTQNFRSLCYGDVDASYSGYKDEENVVNLAEGNGMELSNFPNPFNRTTTIRYTVPVESKVTITIHDLLGNKIATIADPDNYEGIHDMPFNANGLAPGVYLYTVRLDTGDDQLVQTGKMIINR